MTTDYNMMINLIYLLCTYTPIAPSDTAIRGLVKSHMHLKGLIYILNTGGALQSINGYHHAMHCVAYSCVKR